MPILGSEKKQTVLFVYPQIMFVCSLRLFECRSSVAGGHRAVLVSLGEKGPGIYCSVGICLQLGPGLSAS